MSQVFVADGNNYEALSHIRYRNVISNSHKKSLKDGSETFDFTTHADKPYSPYIEGNNRIIIPGEDGDFLEFIIYEIQEDRIERELEVYSYASYAELRTAKVIPEHTTSSLTVGQHAGIALDGTEWRIGIVESDAVRTITFESRTHPYGYLKRLASVFDLELHFRIEHDNGKITGRYVDLLERVGEWRGRRVEFGKDLLGLRRVENTEEIVTALNVIGPEDENGDRLEVVVEDEEAFQRWARNGKHIIKDYEPQFEMDENATEERLIELGEQELAKRVKAIVTYEGTIADLEKVPGLEHKKFRFGDTIQIKDTSYEPALYLDARIFFQDRDIKDQAEKQVRLGDFTEYTQEEVDAIWKSLEQQIKNKISMTDLTEVTYTKPEIEERDKPGNDAADKIETDVGWDEVIETEQGSQEKADQAEENANNHTDQIKEEIDQELLDKADLEYVDGQLQFKADSDLVNTINDTVDDLQLTTDDLLIDVANHADELQAQGGRITTVEYDLDEVEGQLSLAITDLELLENEVSTQGTQISANAEAIGFKADATVVEGLQEEFDALSYENRNLLRNSAVQNGTLDNWTGSGISVIEEGVFSDYAIRFEGSPSGSREFKNTTQIPAGEYIMQIWYKHIVGDTPYLFLNGSNPTDGSVSDDRDLFDPNIEGWQVAKVEFTANSETRMPYIRYASSSPSDHTYGTCIIGAIKIEKGNKATDWSPAPEDFEADISAVGTRVENLSADLEIMAGQIEAKAEKSAVENLEGDFSTLSNEVSSLSVAYDGISADVSSLQSTTDDHTSEISDLNAELEIQAGEISSKVDAIYVENAVSDTGRWTKSYRVRTANPENLTEKDGSALSNLYTYEVTGKVTGTGSNTTAVAIFRSNSTSGSSDSNGWSLEIIYEQGGKSSNQPEFFIDDDGKPSIRLYGHTSYYTVEVTHEKTIGRESSMSVASSEITQLAGEITSKVSTTEFDNLEDRVDTAESTISQHANQIQQKVEENDVRSIFTQEADSFTFDADQINFDGHVFGGDATFTGKIEGAIIEGSSFVSSYGNSGYLEIENGALAFFSGNDSLVLGVYSDEGFVMNKGNNHMQLSSSSLTFNGNPAEVIESQGSNAGGRWIRYASGIQICWAQPFNQATTNTYSSGVSYSDTDYWDFPVSFDDSYPISVSAVCASLGRVCGTTGPPSASSVPIRTYSLSGNTSSTAYSVYTYAVGRWK
ncbi:phage tail spike protein [Gracilibacillus lacisalsi]|uniref:phage tail spike protein n=1 Tax=Gracilibacillus lacisalsi TaxID=393087 RepID=UPI00035EFAAA|nr:phage tail spike protein [Gracilibacillus lacisalsi]